MVLNADIDEYNDGRSKGVCMLLNKIIKILCLFIMTVTISWWIA